MLVLVIANKRRKNLKFLRPCGCGETVSVNLMPGSEQAWMLDYKPRRGRGHPLCIRNLLHRHLATCVCKPRFAENYLAFPTSLPWRSCGRYICTRSRRSNAEQWMVWRNFLLDPNGPKLGPNFFSDPYRVRQIRWARHDLIVVRTSPASVEPMCSGRVAPPEVQHRAERLRRCVGRPAGPSQFSERPQT